jgi:siroheme synthase
MKGLAAAIVESLRAAQAAGREEWLRAEIAAVLVSADEALLERLVTGSRTHAARRVQEMEAAAELERELGVEPHIASAAAAVLAELAREGVHA